METTLRISLVQPDIIWENKEENLSRTEAKIKELRGEADLVVFPEMFTTGFSMQSKMLAEPITGNTIQCLKNWSREYNVALAGSFIAKDGVHNYNRAFFITPQAEEHYYDKHHLFRMGSETSHFSAGERRCIFNYKGWNICIAICYDLRFPVWLRNVGNEYDLLLVVGNWPTSRIHVWDTLLKARSLENQCYVCGVNRVGTDDTGLSHPGHSVLIDPKGNILTEFIKDKEMIQTVSIDLNSLNSFRSKFPVWKDADSFEIL